MAFFGIAEKLSEAGTRLFEAFANVYYPSQAENFANNQINKAKTLAEQSMLWVTFVITSGIVGFTILREPVMTLLFGDTYLSAANAAALFFAVLLFRSLQTLMGYFGVTAGYKFLPVKVSLISSVFNIALCWFMFKSYGYQGAIAALVLTLRSEWQNTSCHFYISTIRLHEPVVGTNTSWRYQFDFRQRHASVF